MGYNCPRERRRDPGRRRGTHVALGLPRHRGGRVVAGRPPLAGRRRLAIVDLRRLRRPGRPRRRRLPGARRPAGRPRRPDDAQHPRVPRARHGRRRSAGPRPSRSTTRRRADQVAVPGRPLRRLGSAWSRTRASSSASSRSAASCRAPRAARHPARPRRHRARRRRSGPTRCSPAEPARPGRGGHGLSTRRPGHDHLHLGHDRAAQGRDDHPRQRRLDRREPAPALRRSSAWPASGSCPTCRWPTSPSA